MCKKYPVSEKYCHLTLVVVQNFSQTYRFDMLIV